MVIVALALVLSIMPSTAVAPTTPTQGWVTAENALRLVNDGCEGTMSIRYTPRSVEVPGAFVAEVDSADCSVDLFYEADSDLPGLATGTVFVRAGGEFYVQAQFTYALGCAAPTWANGAYGPNSHWNGWYAYYDNLQAWNLGACGAGVQQRWDNDAFPNYHWWLRGGAESGGTLNCQSQWQIYTHFESPYRFPCFYDDQAMVDPWAPDVREWLTEIESGETVSLDVFG